MINLLPPQAKEQFKAEERFRLGLVLLVLLLLFFVSLALLLAALRIHIAGAVEAERIRGVVAQQDLVEEEAKAEIAEFNRQIVSAQKLYERQADVSSTLREVGEAMPETASLSSFSFVPGTLTKVRGEVKKASARVVLTGDILTREDLFAFQENLQANPRFVEVDFPPSNWVTPTNIRFSVSFEL